MLVSSQVQTGPNLESVGAWGPGSTPGEAGESSTQSLCQGNRTLPIPAGGHPTGGTSKAPAILYTGDTRGNKFPGPWHSLWVMLSNPSPGVST